MLQVFPWATWMGPSGKAHRSQEQGRIQGTCPLMGSLSYIQGLDLSFLGSKPLINGRYQQSLTEDEGESQSNTSPKYEGCVLQPQPSWIQGSGSKPRLLRNQRISMEMQSASCLSGLFSKDAKAQKSWVTCLSHTELEVVGLVLVVT